MSDREELLTDLKAHAKKIGSDCTDESIAEIVDWMEANGISTRGDDEQGELNKAFAKAQGEMPNAQLNKVNPHFGSSYADIASIRDATVPSLSKHGLGIRQFCRFKGDKLILVTRLAHESGQSEEGEYPVALDRPQAMGSALTYARRYNWAAMCGVGSEEDDDAEEAMRDKPEAKTKKKTREQGNYEALASLIDDTTTRAELEAFMKSQRDTIEALPEDWKKHLRDHYVHHLKGLADG